MQERPFSPSRAETPVDDPVAGIVEELCCQTCDVEPEVLEAVIGLAVEIAREGREGRKVGTIFAVGDAAAVLQRSRSLILDPLLGHPPDVKRLQSPDMRETIKELAQLDGGFVVGRDGTVHSAARYFNVAAKNLVLPLGLGSRHMAGASISRETQAVAVVVSESAIVRIFHRGELISEIIPEVWMLRRHGLHLPGRPRVGGGVAAVGKED